MKLALPGSVILHICIMMLIIFLAHKQITTLPPSGLMPITVHLVTLSEPKQTAPKRAIINKTLTKKPIPVAAKTSVPPQTIQEAKSNNTGPKILSQPMPQIPEDLRREAFSTSAIARFHITTNGTATVELLTPSQNPRLNHLLLEALKNWKFAPATQNGNNIDADFDIRVHFAVN